MTAQQTSLHDAFRELLNTVRECERAWILEDRIDLAVKAERS